MSGVTLNNIPMATSLSGQELVWLYQPGPNPLVSPWIGVSCTTAQLGALINGGGSVFGTCSMRQLFAAMSAQNVLVTAFASLPADITNTYNIAWNHAFRMTIGDAFITGFLQPALGYTAAQMNTLFTLALTYPT